MKYTVVMAELIHFFEWNDCFASWQHDLIGHKKAGNCLLLVSSLKILFTQRETNTGMQANAVQIIKLAAFKRHKIVRSAKR